MATHLLLLLLAGNIALLSTADAKIDLLTSNPFKSSRLLRGGYPGPAFPEDLLPQAPYPDPADEAFPGVPTQDSPDSNWLQDHFGDWTDFPPRSDFLDLDNLLLPPMPSANPPLLPFPEPGPAGAPLPLPDFFGSDPNSPSLPSTLAPTLAPSFLPWPDQYPNPAFPGPVDAPAPSPLQRTGRRVPPEPLPDVSTLLPSPAKGEKVGKKGSPCKRAHSGASSSRPCSKKAKKKSRRKSRKAKKTPPPGSSSGEEASPPPPRRRGRRPPPPPTA